MQPSGALRQRCVFLRKSICVHLHVFEFDHNRLNKWNTAGMPPGRCNPEEGDATVASQLHKLRAECFLVENHDIECFFPLQLLLHV